MHSKLDFWLRHIDNAADDADLDGRKYNPRRDVMKNNLEVLIETSPHRVEDYAERIIAHIEEHELTPNEGRVNRWMMEIVREEKEKPPAGSEGRYNLYPN